MNQSRFFFFYGDRGRFLWRITAAFSLAVLCTGGLNLLFLIQ